MSEYKTTFNYLLTHRVIPEFFFANLDLFYDTIITSPQNMQDFLQQAAKRAVSIAEENPEIEPAYPIEKFEVSLGGPNDENKVIMVTFGKFEKPADCAAIAFPVYREHPRYFTCELSENPLTKETFLIAGEWSPGSSSERLKHSNYGQIEPPTPRGFANKVAAIAYGWDGNTEEDQYTADIPCDIHVRKDIMPDEIRDALADYHNLWSDPPIDEETRSSYIIHLLANSGWAAFRNGDYNAALVCFNKILETDDSSELYFHCRSAIHTAMGNGSAAEYDLFRAKLIDMKYASGGDAPSTEAETILGLENRTPLIESAEYVEMVLNNKDEILFRMNTFPGAVNMPQVFYSGGKNVLLRRRIDQYILIDIENIFSEARDALKKADNIIFAEHIPDEKERKAGNAVSVFKAPVRNLPAVLSLNTIDEIRENAYPLFAFLSYLARESSALVRFDAIPKAELPNLAAILAQEEDYELLEKYIKNT